MMDEYLKLIDRGYETNQALQMMRSKLQKFWNKILEDIARDVSRKGPFLKPPKSIAMGFTSEFKVVLKELEKQGKKHFGEKKAFEKINK